MSIYWWLAVFFYVIVFWIIAKKMGYAGVMSLLMFIPVINFVVMIHLIVGKWPIEKELEEYRKKYGVVTIDDETEDVFCPLCGASIPPGGTECIACGWPEIKRGL